MYNIYMLYIYIYIYIMWLTLCRSCRFILKSTLYHKHMDWKSRENEVKVSNFVNQNKSIIPICNKVSNKVKWPQTSAPCIRSCPYGKCCPSGLLQLHSTWETYAWGAQRMLTGCVVGPGRLGTWIVCQNYSTAALHIYIYIYLVDSAECPRQAVLSWQGVLNKLIKGLVVSSCHNPSRFKKFMRAQCLPPNAPVPRISNCTNRILPIEH